LIPVTTSKFAVEEFPRETRDSLLTPIYPNVGKPGLVRKFVVCAALSSWETKAELASEMFGRE
jgi:hypothetical protein